jgi:hypothetical protein
VNTSGGFRDGGEENQNERATSINPPEPSNRPYRRCRAGLALTATGANAAQLAQSAVKYQPTPKDSRRCDGCNLFVAPNACKSVAGDIAPAGWCVRWVKKAG